MHRLHQTASRRNVWPRSFAHGATSVLRETQHVTVGRPAKFNAFGAEGAGEGHNFAEEEREAARARCERHEERLVQPAVDLMRMEG